MKPSDSKRKRPRLALHLGIMLLVKFAVLALLWYQLVMPYRVEVDARAMEQRLTLASPHSNLKGEAHDRSDCR